MLCRKLIHLCTFDAALPPTHTHAHTCTSTYAAPPHHTTAHLCTLSSLTRTHAVAYRAGCTVDPTATAEATATAIATATDTADPTVTGNAEICGIEGLEPYFPEMNNVCQHIITNVFEHGEGECL